MAMLAYEGARTDRRTDGWVTAATSADAESMVGNGKLRDRARHLVANNPYAARAIRVKVSNTIGTGIVGEATSKALAPIWDAFVENCDADGHHDFYGLQSLVERCRMESGEALVRFVPSKKIKGSVALKMRVLEPDFIDESRDGIIGRDGSFIKYGIEYDQFGVAVAYHIFREHPGDVGILSRLRSRGRMSDRVPAEEIVHIFRKTRAGQTRGVSDFAPVMMRIRDMDDVDDAEISRQKVQACFGAFVTTPDVATGRQIGPTKKTDEIGDVEGLYPAMLTKLKPGEHVEFSEPKGSGGYSDFQRFGLRAISSGVGVPYELVASDLSQVSYISGRLGLVVFKRDCEVDQYLMHVPRFCNRVAARFQQEASIISPGFGERTAFRWTPPRFELFDPLKETQADVEACLAGFDTWDEIVRRRGWDAKQQLDRIGMFQSELKRRGIVLTSDAAQALAAKKATDNEEPPPSRDVQQEAA